MFINQSNAAQPTTAMGICRLSNTPVGIDTSTLILQVVTTINLLPVSTHERDRFRALPMGWRFASLSCRRDMSTPCLWT